MRFFDCEDSPSFCKIAFEVLPSLLRNLQLLENPEASDCEREAAEKTVMAACLEYGEWIGHGDLLNVKMIMEARMLMAGSSTAFERLDFLGPVRIQLLHMKMKKVTQDYGACMPHMVNYEDVLTLPWTTALTHMKVSNKAKEIKKNDSSFERHDQFLATVQTSYLVNMFDNYMDLHPYNLAAVETEEDAVNFVLSMLKEFGIQLYYDPSKNNLNQEEDDLFKYCKVSK